LVSFALMLVMAGYLAGCGSYAQQPGRVTQPDSTREQVASRSPEPAARVPSEDAPGSDLSGLPRYPGSVRVEYSRGQRGGLETIRARYLTRDGLDAVRGYYRGIFRAEGWGVANAEFYDDEWTFLVLHGAREAEIEIEAHEGNVTGMHIRLSEPVPERETATKKTPQKNAKSPASRRPTPAQPPQAVVQATPAPAPQSASPSPAPQSASPAPQSASPAPGYYGDDFGDDGGDD
jgi:hypothetical protein